MKEVLIKYIPEASVETINNLLKKYKVHLIIKRERITRHGDYRKLPNGQHKITVNVNLNKYRFLITLVHEIAHLVAIEKYGRNIKPHGIEWKKTFQLLMLQFINPSVFPNHLLPIIANHFKNPKASSDTDAHLSIALKYYDEPNDKNYVFEIPEGSIFKIKNGKVFKRGKKLRKRFECKEINSGRIYSVSPNAEVILIK